MTDRPEADDDSAQPSAETQTAESDLQRLLQEFQSNKPERRPEPKPAPLPDDLQPVVEFAKTEMAERQQQKFKADVDTAIKFLLEPDELKDIPTPFARGILEAQAAEDPAFAKAFSERHSNPKAWQSALSDVRKFFAEEAKKLPGNKVRSDLEAARASVAGENANQEPAELDDAKVLAMSDAEFMEFTRQQLANASR